MSLCIRSGVEEEISNNTMRDEEDEEDEEKEGGKEDERGRPGTGSSRLRGRRRWEEARKECHFRSHDTTGPAGHFALSYFRLVARVQTSPRPLPPLRSSCLFLPLPLLD